MFNSIQIYLNSAFHNTYCFNAALQKVHFGRVHRKIDLCIVGVESSYRR